MKRTICEYGRRKEICRDCHGSQICVHDKVKTQCKACGTALCPHKQWKGNCALCRPIGGYERYQKSAEARGISFQLTFELFSHMIAQSCRYCGKSPCGGVDRLDSDQGYAEHNVVPCCTTCNRMKLLLGEGEGEFLAQVRRIYQWSPCCTTCNRMKLLLGEGEFLAQVRRIYQWSC